MQTTFITDGLLRKSLSATRSLGRRGIATVVGENSWFSPSGFSKYCQKRMKYPDPKEDRDHFLDWLLHRLEQENLPVFMPMDDAVMDIVMENLEDIKKLSRIILPSKLAYDVASNKYETMKLAKEQLVGCPATFLPKSEEDLAEIAETTVFPLVIKPRKSSGSRGIRKVENKDELLEVFHEIKKKYPEPMIQEYIPLGDRYDVCLLYDQKHEVKASFVQKELRHFPIQIGPSTVQESVDNEKLIMLSVHLLEPLNWSGIVEVEYMVDPRTNQPVLMEINPRFWNSLNLAVECGIDFPYLLYQLSMDEKITFQKEYEIGRKNRWLFPGDFLHFLLNSKRFSMKPSFFSGKKQSVYDDTFSLSDPLPGLILLVSCFRYALSIKTWKMFFKR
jgi:predicted ATP-grasp superfamily ATP-dependent carboligase